MASIAAFVLVAVGGVAVTLLSSTRGASATPPPPGAFVLTYDSTKAGCSIDGTIALPFTGDLDARIDWGDGSVDSWTTGQTPTHTYSSAGSRIIEVTNIATRFGSGNTTWIGAKCITSVVQWGDLGITSLSGALSGATNLTSVPDWLPASVTDISFMFDGATSFNGRIGNWETAANTSLEGTFRGATSFNQSLNTWNTAAVTNFAETFSGASAFNRPLNNWTTPLATTFRAMFKNATAFNQPVNIDPTNANDASEMFRGASAFNQYFAMWPNHQGANAGTTLKGMFRDASAFNQRIDWNTYGITDMSDMFRGATMFNGYVNSMQMQTVTDASHMFDGATSFNGDVTQWQTWSLQTTNSMFRGATSFNGYLGSASTSNVTDMAHMFDGATSFNSTVSNFDTRQVVTMNSMFNGAKNFNADLTGWDVSLVTDAGSMFAGAASFDQLLSNWNVGAMTNISHMFDGATRFGRANSGSGGLALWNVSNVTDMTSAFANTLHFNQDLSAWTTTSLTRALGVFSYARAFDQSLATWDTTHLVDGDGLGIEYSAISTMNYSKALAAWGRQAQPARSANSIRLDAADKSYDRVWEQSRRFSLKSKGWKIIDAGRAVAQTPLSLSYDFTDALSDAGVVDAGGMTVFLPLTGVHRLTVDWGDGSTETFGAGSTASHFYSFVVDDPEIDLTYTVSVTGEATGFDSRVHGTDTLDGMQFVSAIGSWGQVGLTSMEHGLSNMTGLKTAVPALPATVRTLAHMYDGLVSPSAASGLVAPPSSWVTSNVVDMSSMFEGSNLLIADLSGWDTSNVIDMSAMFAGTPGSSHPSVGALDLSGWNVSTVENMNSMFRESNFNGSIIDWNVSNVREMASMFAGDVLFDQPLTTWDVGRVTSMTSMFQGATSFDQPLGAWNTRSVTSFNAMFDGASSLDQSFANWSLGNGADMGNFISSTAISTSNYGETLEGFARSLAYNVALGSDGLTYDSRGEIARTRLVNERGWVISGDTAAPAGAPMTMTFDSTSATECGTNDVVLPLGSHHGVTVDWGDGGDAIPYGPGENVWHSYVTSGVYKIAVTGVAEHFGSDSWQGLGCITKVGSYGELGLTDLSSAWSYSSHLTQLPLLPPRVTNISKMFYNASTFDLDVSGWDTSNVVNMAQTFFGAAQFDQALNGWDTSNVVDMTQMFFGATAFDQDLSGWDTSKVIYMTQMFYAADAFNGNISTWDTSKVSTMSQMFYGARMFNSAIGGWDTSRVTTMSQMFLGAAAFNQPIGDWNTSSLTQMDFLFAEATSFNQSLSGWDVSHVTSMATVFRGATRFNGDISTWDTSSVTDFNGMFSGATAFDSPIGFWDVTLGQNFTGMFESSGFNQPIERWTMRSATNTSRMFNAATRFNQNLVGWEMSRVSNTESMFVGALSFNGDISTWDTSAITWAQSMFQGATSFNGDLSSWNLDRLTVINNMFYDASSFNQSLGQWNLAVMTQAYDVFNGSGISARGYTDTLIGWADQVGQGSMSDNGVLRASKAYYAEAQSSVDTLRSHGWSIQDDGEYLISPMTLVMQPVSTECGSNSISLAFGGPTVDGFVMWGDGAKTVLSEPGTVSHTYADDSMYVISIYGEISTFGDGTELAGTDCITGVGQWGHLNLRALPGAFRGWSNLVSFPSESPGRMIDLSNTFRDATSFNVDLNWDTSGARTTSHMFDGATSFNSWVDGWNLASATDVSYMFANATSFARSFPYLNVPSVRNFSHMFDGATSFNSSLVGWTTSSATDMSHMFRDAPEFNQNLQAFDVSLVSDMTDMFVGSGLSTFNYDQALIGWSSRPTMSGVTLGATGRGYRTDAASARRILTMDRGWTILDDGPAAEAPMVLVFDTTMTDCNPGIWLPITGGLGFSVDWGDGSTPYTVAPGNDWAYHEFAAGTFTVTISGEAGAFGHGGDWQGNRCLKSVTSFGEMGMTSLFAAFYNATNLISVSPTMTSTVTDMRSMFQGATSFNGDISDWNTSKVTKMGSMFQGATAFNSDVSSWNTAKVTDMQSMFSSASTFTSDLSAWDVSHVVDMNYMFSGATAFDQSLATWHLDRLQTAYNFLDGSRISPIHYADSLKGWANAPTTADNVNMTNQIWYSASAQTARDALVTKGWSLNDSGAYPVSPMTLIVDNRLSSCSGLTQTLPVSGTVRDEVIVDWGDGTITPIAEGTTPSHTYASAGEYTVAISGLAERFGSDVTGTESAYIGADCITALTSWGGTEFTSLEGAFRGATNLTSVPTNLPTSVTNLSWMFADATAFNAEGVQYWNLYYAADLSHMFEGATSFNANVNSWDVTNILDMSHMFDGASEFQGYLTSWRPERTTNMASMFEDAAFFNADIRDWGLVSVTNMSNMFDRSGLTTWTYDILLNAWSLQELQENVTLGASTTTYRAKAEVARTHLIDDLGWTVADGGLLPDIPMVMTIDTSKPECNGAVTFPFTSIRDMTIDYGDGSDPVVLGPGNDYPTHTYEGVAEFIVTVHGEVDNFGQFGGWSGVGCLTSVSSFGELGMLSLASAFSGAANLTTVPTKLPATVTDISRMFGSAIIFNQDISVWDVSHVKTMQAMFHDAHAFNQPIGSWNIGRVTDLSWMFQNATAFNQNLATWNTSRVTTLEGMFHSAVAFNGTVDGWDTKRVENMVYVFENATAFNKPVNAWNFSNVASTQRMFYGASSFNQPVSSWNTGKVLNMMAMFSYASEFNQPIGGWDVSKVVYMGTMLLEALKFDQPLDGWHLASLQNAGELVGGTAVSPHNYGKSLTAWATFPDTAPGIYMTNWSLKYSASSAAAHDELINSRGWTLGDAGVFSSTPMTLTVDTSITDCDLTPIEIPVGGVISDTPIVDWGDGLTSTYVTGTSPSHVYEAAGQYTVSVNGVFSHFGDPSGYLGAQCITGITDWGDAATTDLAGAFKGATNLAALPTLPSAVTDLSSAFADNSTFNLDMSGWDVGNVEHFDNMFAGSTSFNSDISGWDMSSAKTMNGMFSGATAFDRSLADWSLNSVTSMSDGFARSAISEANWTATLIGWASNVDIAQKVALDASGHTWLVAASAAHTSLTGTSGWVFTNDGGLVDIPLITSVPSGVHGDRRVTVSWSALTDAEKMGADVDRIVVAAFNNAGPEFATCEPATLSTRTCVFSGLTNGTAYTFKLKAHNRIGWSEYSLSSNTVTPSTVPAKAAISSTAIGSRKVTVNWSAPAANGAPITGYVVTAYAGGVSTGRTCSPSPATGLTCDVTGLANGTAYTFKLVASNLNGPGAESNASGSVTPLGAPEAPAVPTTKAGNAKVTVTWAAPANGGSAITGYLVTTYAAGSVVAGKTCVPTPATGLTCDVAGLANGTSYTFRVKATNAIGTGSNSADSLVAVPATIPSTPTAPTVTRGNTRVTVTWVAPFNGGSTITGYSVTTFAAGVAVAGKTCATASQALVACDVTGLANGTAYTFKVKATNLLGSSVDSAASTSITPATVPNAPAAPTTVRGNGQVTVNWVAPTVNGGSPITGYTVTTFAGGTVVVGKTCSTASPTAVTCNVTGLSNGTAYTFKVKATNVVGSTESAASAAVTPAAAPKAPAAPTAVKGHQSVQLSWVAPAANGSAITGYTVTVFAGGTAVTGKTCPLSPATATTCVMTGLTNGTAYTFKVKATNAVGSTDSAASIAVTPAAVPVAPTAPRVAVGVGVGANKATITWVAPANNGSAITGFTVTAFTSSGTSAGTCTTTAVTALSCSITGLTTGVTYTFKVMAKNANGFSFQSPPTTGIPT